MSRVCVFVSFVFLVFLLPWCRTLDVHGFCYDECESRMEVDEDGFDVACNDTCKVEKCRDGCDSWKEGVSDSCQDACVEDEVILNKSWNLYCVIGCNIAISAYITKLKGEFGTPSAPYLVAATCTHHSVTIEWTKAPFENISYLVHWRYSMVHVSSDWEYYEPTTLLNTNNLTLIGLQPYANYKFRVAWILLKNLTPLFSEESVVISTLPFGTPSTPPKIIGLTAVGPTSVSVSWEPPPFSNGAVLSYVLYAREINSGFVTIKDISLQDTLSASFHFMFNYLEPATSYDVSVKPRNGVGEGPADTRNISTPPRELLKSTYKLPYLVFSADQQVLKQGLRILDDATVLYRSSSSITGVALHVKMENFFLSHSDGHIRKVELKGKKYEIILKLSEHLPTILSVDWLNEKLYMAEDDRISRCNLNGKFYETVLTGLVSHTTELHVDPYNGYLFWSTNDTLVGGVYRIDLAELDSEVKTLEDAQLVVKDKKIVSFVVDYKNFRLLLPSQDKNTVMSSALDGSDEIDIRVNSQTSQFTDVKSIAVHDNLFYWTNGIEIFAEEHEKTEDLYYHNAYALRNGPFSNINIYHPHSEPDPVPLNPVENVQAIFTDRMIQIHWTKPRLIGGTGKGAWQNWLYEVRIVSKSTGYFYSAPNITRNTFVSDDLEPNTDYTIKVRSYSYSGKGPWSEEFSGRTLKSSNFPSMPYLLWSSQDGLLKSDAVGENVQLLLHTKLKLNKAHITGISWFYKKVFLSTNASDVYVYQMSDYSLSRLSNLTNAASIAIDWFAPKIYWSNPIQQMILRANLDGSQCEPTIPTIAKQLAIDSRKGFIYWSTSHSIECSRLNGDDHFIYMKNELFSGKHVIGLTLDLDNDQVYWVVRSYEGSLTYRAALARLNGKLDIELEMISALLNDDRRGPLWYFSDRFFSLHEQKGAIISDMNGHNVAALHGFKMDNLKTLAIIDPALQPYPDGLNEATIRVVPTSISESSVQVEGTWEDFNITWEPIKSINYGPLFYEIKVDDGQQIFTSVQNETVFPYSTLKSLPPYSALSVAVKAFTYYASARQTVVLLYSPMSIPSKPLGARVFIDKKLRSPYANEDIEAIFRWLAPSSPNGLILGYEIAYWAIESNDTKPIVFHRNIFGSILSYHIDNLKARTTYHFQVRAFTEIGYGPYSNIVRVNTATSTPVPYLIVATSESIKLLDMDTQQERTITTRANSLVELTYIANEGKIFWIEDNGPFMSSSVNGTNVTMLSHSSSKATCLAIDWVARQLYWVERSKGHSTIWCMDLDNEKFTYSVLNYSGIITSLAVEPLTSSLLWIVKNVTGNELMISTIKGKNVRALLRDPQFPDESPPRSRHCNCSNISVGNTMTLDYTDPTMPKVLWVNTTRNDEGTETHIWVSNLHGCKCQVLAKFTELINDLRPTSLTVDGSRIYWHIGSAVYSTKRQRTLVEKYGGGPSKIHNSRNYRSGIRSMLAYGNNLQPFPDCFLSQHSTVKVSAPTARSSTSLKFQLSPVETLFPENDFCIHKNSSTATMTYIVSYRINRDGSRNEECSMLSPRKENCLFQKTIDGTTLTIRNLRPFTNYSIKVATLNYYTKNASKYGPTEIYQTEEGTPSPPTNVFAQAVTPHRIDVFWDPPRSPNGFPISYEVRWRASNTPIYSHSVKYVPPVGRTNKFIVSVVIFESGVLHYVVVHAYSPSGTLQNVSEEIPVETCAVPGNLTLIKSTIHSLEVKWTAPSDSCFFNHTLEYSLTDDTKWTPAQCNDIQEMTYLYEANNLISKHKYKFRLTLSYLKGSVKMQWPNEYIFETEGDVPGKPGEPQVKSRNQNSHEIFWNSSSYNDGITLLYELQMNAEVAKNPENEDAHWITVYNGSDTLYPWSANSTSSNYEFRVRAINEYGGSNYSFMPNSYYFAGAITGTEHDQIGTIMASGVGTLLFLFIFLVVIYMVHRKRENEKKMEHDDRQNQELATLHELPSHDNFVRQSNALYNLSDLPVDEELLALPQVSRRQINVTKFLGRGAFGEVFEGIAHELIEGLPPTKVAVKTLRKGATEHEKEEFLKEAKLMSNFKHDHIIELLGVCFDNNPTFIILELMEGGDLLSYLRSNRPTIFQRSMLTLDDLFGICVDVAEGCKYLEDMHFVHRDIAARNCLVSSYDRQQRIVKIGDFGLSRDLYENDYYRKEGEGLLPVRWMATESLVYGIFTTESDVWAFGVLLWEVITFGQQPYQARTNIEVLHYVRDGGRLDKPENCTNDLYEIMKRCWSHDPNNRPSFRYCLRTLQELKRNYAFMPSHIATVQNQNYLRHTIDEYLFANHEANRNEEKDLSVEEGDNISIRSDPVRTLHSPNLNAVKRSASLNHPSRFEGISCDLSDLQHISNKNGFVNNYNKYLELLAGNEDADGYEIPIRAIRKSFRKEMLRSQKCNSRNVTEMENSNQTKDNVEQTHKPLLAPFYAEVFSSFENHVEEDLASHCLRLSGESDSQKNNLLNERCVHPSPFTNHSNHLAPCESDIPQKLIVENALDAISSMFENDFDSDENSCEKNSSSDNDKWSISTTSTLPFDCLCSSTNPIIFKSSSDPEIPLKTEINVANGANSSCC